MRRTKDFPNRCLGCKREDVPLSEFKYNRRKTKKNYFLNSQTIITERFSFPACDSCEEKFRRAMKKRNRVRKAKRIPLYTAFIFIAAIFLVNFGIMDVAVQFVPLSRFLFIILVFGTIVIVPAIIVLVIGVSALHNPYRIENFLAFHKDGTFSIKDPDYAREANEKAKKRIDEEVKEELFGIDEEEGLYCPKCGKQWKKGTDFCKTCGKDLRVVVHQ
ncbi:MAG: hypothetical protein JW891_04355 [Candidatus Lokiarchaeota archaeon]|nr:hypothetical protein [Candidatus Lokiarchaeota archaeon]